jgi:hypothetical protein
MSSKFDSAAPLDEAIWQKSSFSGSNGGSCVDVARNFAGRVLVRDSKDPDGPVLEFTHAEWKAFTQGVSAGELGV